MSEPKHIQRARAPYRIVGKRVWAVIRQRYLAGETAPALARAYGVTKYAIRAQIGRNGWTKRSLAEAEAETIIQEAEARLPSPSPRAVEATARGLDDASPGDLAPRDAARRALALAAQLLAQGRMAEAAEAARIAETMSRAAARLDGDEDGPEAEDEAAFEAVRRKVLGWAEPALAGAGDAADPGPPLRGSPSPAEDGA